MRFKDKSPYWLAGLLSTLIGLGIGRFAFTALIPLLIQDGWSSAFEAAQLGAAALVGYLAGPIFVNVTQNRFRTATMIKVALILCALGYIFVAWHDLGFYWMYVWRFLAGFGGALLMVLSPTLILPYYKKSQNRGLLSGVVFSGIGIGVCVSGLLIPYLYEHIGLSEVFIALGLVCLLFTWLTWSTWDRVPVVSESQPLGDHSTVRFDYRNKNFLLLLTAYCCNAVGYIPHTLFYVDFLVRQMHKSFAFGAMGWTFFGIGALLGPVLLGKLSDLIGLKNTILVSYFIYILAVFMPVLITYDIAFYASAFIVGFFTPGMITLISSYALRIFGDLKYKLAWSNLTLGFSFFQAIGGFSMAFLIKNDNYYPLFYIGGVFLIVSFISILAIKHRETKGT